MNNTQSQNTDASSLDLARGHVRNFTVVAAVTGGIPVPAASVAIVAENAVMINAIASAMGIPVSLETVATSIGLVGSVNIVGRAVFVEAARALGWFGGPAGVAGVVALGATTAAVQTWALGTLTIAICANGGQALPSSVARNLMSESRTAFNEFWADRERARAHQQ